MSIIPAPEADEKPTSSNVQLPTKRWEDLDEIAEYETKRRGKFFSRVKVIDHLLKWAIDQYWRDEKSKK